ncbi:J-domain-containing protein, partial [Rhodococcus sp. MEB064]|uniref:DnaJ family domain-containing protein n=1 Tax=Rhodococcus sp. MEB064 TaxID=1587522 RepID=UPI0005ABF0D0
MTQRKPWDISVQTWVDRQIREAQEKGAFDDLPGLGKPIPPSSTDELSWVRGYLERENLPGDALLPTPLRLRKEVERLPETLRDVRSEEQVRAVVKDLNARIMDWLRAPVGPQVPI